MYKHSLTPRQASITGILLMTLWSTSIPALETGDPAPSFVLPALGGDGSIRLSDYKGQVVYLDFWASWCAPCRVSLPLLSRLRDQLNGQGFEVVAVDVDQNPEDGRRFLASYPVSYPVASDSTGRFTSEYELIGMPSSFLIDRQGRVRFVHQGFKKGDIEKVRDLALELLAE
jgi:peroxiredoxin